MKKKKCFTSGTTLLYNNAPANPKIIRAFLEKKTLRIILFCIVNPKHKHDSVSTFLDPNHFMCVCACVRIRAYGKK